MMLHRDIDVPIREGLSTQELWLANDQGLIACWERGRELAAEQPELAKRARAGELVPLPWKGGLEKAMKAKKKVGTTRYLAMWQGLRGDDLDVDTEAEPTATCSRFGVEVTFTADAEKFADA